MIHCNENQLLTAYYVYVTGSAKTGHNRTSLNLQYKALNTLGAYLRIVKKNSVNFLNVSFSVKEGRNNKNLDIILFAYTRGARKSLFRCCRPKDSEVMGTCLRHVEMIVRD